MKYILFTIVVSTILLSSCGHNSNKKTDTHIHEDGTEHISHDNASDVALEQEVFEVENDSAQIENHTLKGEHKTEEHSHDGNHEHKH